MVSPVAIAVLVGVLAVATVVVVVLLVVRGRATRREERHWRSQGTRPDWGAPPEL